jgi:hypothetical protein
MHNCSALDLGKSSGRAVAKTRHAFCHRILSFSLFFAY